MARDLANTAGSPDIDYITYSGAPLVAGLGTCSVVARLALDANCPTFGTAFIVQGADISSAVAIGREGTTESVYFCFRNADAGPRQIFPFASDGAYRSVIVTFDGNASPKTCAYNDGVSQTLTGTAPTNTTIGSGQTVAVIGGTAGFRMNGRVAEIAVYNRVITPAEALIHAAGYSTNHFPRGRIFCAPLIREVHDIVGGLTGTITGTTVTEHPRIYA